MSQNSIFNASVRNYRIFQCLVNSNWKQAGMANIVVARINDRKIYYGLFLVDIHCTGIRDTFCDVCSSISEFNDVLASIDPNGRMLKEVDYDLVHSIVFSSVVFAAQFGFEPHAEFLSEASWLFSDPAAYTMSNPITCGKEGKPYLLIGDHNAEAAEAIMLHLNALVGEDGYFTDNIDENFEGLDFDVDNSFMADVEVLKMVYQATNDLAVTPEDMNTFREIASDENRMPDFSMLVVIQKLFNHYADKETCDNVLLAYKFLADIIISDEYFAGELNIHRFDEVTLADFHVDFLEVADLMESDAADTEEIILEKIARWGESPMFPMLLCQYYLQTEQMNQLKASLAKGLWQFPDFWFFYINHETYFSETKNEPGRLPGWYRKLRKQIDTNQSISNFSFPMLIDSISHYFIENEDAYSIDAIHRVLLNVDAHNYNLGKTTRIAFALKGIFVDTAME